MNKFIFNHRKILLSLMSFCKQKQLVSLSANQKRVQFWNELVRMKELFWDNVILENFKEETFQEEKKVFPTLVFLRVVLNFIDKI